MMILTLQFGGVCVLGGLSGETEENQVDVQR